jgi:hypothetical protein
MLTGNNFKNSCAGKIISISSDANGHKKHVYSSCASVDEVENSFVEKSKQPRQKKIVFKFKYQFFSNSYQKFVLFEGKKALR